MRIKSYSEVKKLQEGGQVAPAAPAQGEDQAMQQIAQLAQQLIQELGPDAAAMLAQVIMEMLQGAPQEVGAAPQEQQFMRKGGKLCKCGGKTSKAKTGKKIKACK